MTAATLPRPRFAHGALMMTPGVRDLIVGRQLNVLTYLERHLQGDWGDVCEEDRKANDAALESGDRLLSAYEIKPNGKIWIITEYDRSVTTILLPEEY